MSRHDLPPLDSLLAGATVNAFVGFIAVILAGASVLRAVVCGVSAAVAITIAALIWMLLARPKEGS